jgi:replication factor C small subunit
MAKEFEVWAEKYRPKTFDEIINQENTVERVKAFAKSKNIPHMLFAGPPGSGKTTLALVLAKELYGDQWKQNVLQMNASDARGIDVIRGEVKEFARTVAIGDVPFKLIILDEADAMTSDAQQALRRMMEMYASVSRFILICNYSSKIIEPIQSRCAVFRFKALDDKHVEEFVNRIVEGEKLKITEDGIKAIVRISEGDLRRAANILQVASALKEKITEDTIYEAASLAKPQEVKQMLELALNGKFIEARKMLEEMIIKKGLAGSDIIAEIHRQIPSLNIDDRAKVELIEKCGEVDFRISEGANELIQLESLLASFLLYAHAKGKK